MSDSESDSWLEHEYYVNKLLEHPHREMLYHPQVTVSRNSVTVRIGNYKTALGYRQLDDKSYVFFRW